ncbi:fungal-specific transcription factor domain-containing protein [Gongronella butleri]|nr:fungal-specific transcription factor domain-containing protein [Gongronella butleri]
MCMHYVCECTFRGTCLRSEQQYAPRTSDNDTEKMSVKYNGEKIMRYMGRSSVYYDVGKYNQYDIDDFEDYYANAKHDMHDMMPVSLQKELIKRFANVQSLVTPIIDKEVVLEYADQLPTNPLLVCAICSYVHAVTPLDDKVFEQHGIKDRKQLYQQLLNLENELLKTECLTPSITNIQALLIICCRPTNLRHFNNIWLQSGLAVRMCQDLGFHLKLRAVSYSEKMEQLGRRLWYISYMFDRWVSSVLGRPLAIQDSDCSVTLPAYAAGDREGESFVLFIKLSWVLGEVQRRLYTPRAKANLGKLTQKQMLDQIQSLEGLLAQWQDQIPDYLRVTMDDIKALDMLSADDKATLLASPRWQLGGYMIIGAFAVHILIHRPFLSPDDRGMYIDSSAARCTELACLGMDLLSQMPSKCYAILGWNVLMYCGVLCTLVIAHNCTSADPETVAVAKHYFEFKILDWLTTLENTAPFNEPVRPHMRMAMQLLRVGSLFQKIMLALSTTSNSSTSTTASPADSTSHTSDTQLPTAASDTAKPSTQTTSAAPPTTAPPTSGAEPGSEVSSSAQPLNALSNDFFAGLRSNLFDGFPSGLFGLDGPFGMNDLLLQQQHQPQAMFSTQPIPSNLFSPQFQQVLQQFDTQAPPPADTIPLDLDLGK